MVGAAEAGETDLGTGGGAADAAGAEGVTEATLKFCFKADTSCCQRPAGTPSSGTWARAVGLEKRGADADAAFCRASCSRARNSSGSKLMSAIIVI